MHVSVQFSEEDRVENHTGMKHGYVLKVSVFIISGFLPHIVEQGEDVAKLKGH